MLLLSCREAKAFNASSHCSIPNAAVYKNVGYFRIAFIRAAFAIPAFSLPDLGGASASSSLSSAPLPVRVRYHPHGHVPEKSQFAPK